MYGKNLWLCVYLACVCVSMIMSKYYWIFSFKIASWLWHKSFLFLMFSLSSWYLLIIDLHCTHCFLSHKIKENVFISFSTIALILSLSLELSMRVLRGRGWFTFKEFQKSVRLKSMLQLFVSTSVYFCFYLFFAEVLFT